MQYDQPLPEQFDGLRIVGDHDIDFWACVLDVTEFDVRRAIATVGNGVADVVQLLQGVGIEVPQVWH
jgi:hypothetical protein